MSKTYLNVDPTREGLDLEAVDAAIDLKLVGLEANITSNIEDEIYSGDLAEGISPPNSVVMTVGGANAANIGFTSNVTSDIQAQLDLKVLDSDWVAFTPTGTWSANTTYTGFMKVIGDTLYCRVKVALAGAPETTAMNVNLPAGYSFDNTKIYADQYAVVGTAIFFDAAPAAYLGSVFRGTTDTVVRLAAFGTASSYATLTVATQAVPFTFAANDFITLEFSLPFVYTP